MNYFKNIKISNFITIFFIIVINLACDGTPPLPDNIPEPEENTLHPLVGLSFDTIPFDTLVKYLNIHRDTFLYAKRNISILVDIDSNTTFKQIFDLYQVKDNQEKLLFMLFKIYNEEYLTFRHVRDYSQQDNMTAKKLDKYSKDFIFSKQISDQIGVNRIKIYNPYAMFVKLERPENFGDFIEFNDTNFKIKGGKRHTFKD